MRVVVLEIKHKAKQYQIEQRDMFSPKLLVSHSGRRQLAEACLAEAVTHLAPKPTLMMLRYAPAFFRCRAYSTSTGITFSSMDSVFY